jgi:fructose-bisphosphate aldolase class II
MAITAKIRQVFTEQPKEIDPMIYLGLARDAIKEIVRHKLRLLGCAGKAQQCL